MILLYCYTFSLYPCASGMSWDTMMQEMKERETMIILFYGAADDAF
jgi:hypothetical protein